MELSSSISQDMFKTYDVYHSTKAKKDIYENSVFGTIKNLSSRSKGSAFEKIVEEYLVGLGCKKLRNENSGHDRIFVINDRPVKIEIKGSTIWGEKLSGIMKWQQIRTSQDYDVIVFLAMLPDRIDLYWSTKSEVTAFVEQQSPDGKWKYNQHGGNKVNSGTFAINGRPEDFPFMKPIDSLLS